MSAHSSTGPSPFWPRHLFDLFFRPGRFFASHLALGKTRHLLLAGWLNGATAAIDRIDSHLIQISPGGSGLLEEGASYLADSWTAFWLFVLLSGAIAGYFLWWVAGWWFALRLRWSGVNFPDYRLARVIMLYSSFVYAAPAVLATGVATIFFRSYTEAFDAAEWYSVGVLVFFFWSVATTYVGARTAFQTSAWRARLWFLIVPGLFYLAVGAMLVTLLPEQ